MEQRRLPEPRSKSALCRAYQAETLCRERAPRRHQRRRRSNSRADSSLPKIRGPPKVRMGCVDKTLNARSPKIQAAVASHTVSVAAKFANICRTRKNSSYGKRKFQSSSTVLRIQIQSATATCLARRTKRMYQVTHRLSHPSRSSTRQATQCTSTGSPPAGRTS